jgi:hypothetical protein
MKNAMLALLVLGLVGSAFWYGERRAQTAEAELATANEKIDDLAEQLKTKDERIAALDAAQEESDKATIDDFARKKRDRDSQWLEKDGSSDSLGAVDPENFLEGVKISDLFTEIRLGHKFTEIPQSLIGINGSFAGKLNVDGHPTLSAKFDLTISDALWDDELKGKLVVKLVEHNQEFVSNGNEGKLTAISQLDGSSGFLIHVRPAHYFQVYAIRDGQTLIGNYYRQGDKAGTYDYLGWFVAEKVTRKSPGKKKRK